MRQKKSEQQHYHSRDDYDHISSASSSSTAAAAVVKSTESSSYIQLQHKHSHMLTLPKLKQSCSDFRWTRSYLILFLLSSFLVLSFTYFIRYPKQKQTDFDLNHRVKRQLITNHNDANDAQHYTNMLRRMLSSGVSSTVLADCTINMASDGIYYPPSSKTLSSETINLVESTFHNALHKVKSTASKIRQKLNLSSNGLVDFALAKFSTVNHSLKKSTSWLISHH